MPNDRPYRRVFNWPLRWRGEADTVEARRGPGRWLCAPHSARGAAGYCSNCASSSLRSRSFPEPSPSHLPPPAYGAVVGMIAIGLGCGIVAAAGLSRLLGAMLVETSALGAPAFVVAIVALSATAVLAAAGPAYRATRLDPMIALRAE
ncbi:MAG: hypothetical protein ABI637_02760 [Gemmatimonadota bacterium]